jgi:tetratricopeptide (TPR) repeat protein
MKKQLASWMMVIVLVLSVVTACAKAAPPLSAAELLDLGEKYLLELNYEQALVQFLKVIEIEPMNPRGYTGAAEAYIGLGREADAIAVLRQGHELLPGNADIQAMLDDLLLPSTELDPLLEAEDENEPERVSQDFTPAEIELMETLYQAIIRADYRFLYSFADTLEFDELFFIDTESRIGMDDLYWDWDYDTVIGKLFTWESEHGIISFERYGREGKERTYNIRFGDMDNGTYYYFSGGELAFGFDDYAESVQLLIASHEHGLSNGRYDVYRYTPNRTGFSHTTGNAVNGVKHGTEIFTYTLSDGTKEVAEFNYDNGVCRMSCEICPHYIGRFFDGNEYSFLVG